MKPILLAFMAVISSTAFAQVKEGRVVYERTVQLPARMFAAADPAIAAQLPKARTDQYELLFSGTRSLWQYLPNASNEGEPNTFASGGVIIRMQGGANDVSYQDFEKGTRIEHREIADRSFVVTDTIAKINWKLTDETKMILDHTARQAVATRVNTRFQMTMENGEMKRTPIQDTSKIIAWFTTDIPVSAGPADFQGQLPGLILEMDISNGQTVYKALELSSKVNASKIKEPKDGKKLTAAEFTTERDKLMEEMRKNMQGGGRTFKIQQ